MRFILEKTASNYDLSENEGRIGFLKEAAAALARLSSSIEREIYASQAAQMASISKDALLSEVERRRRQYTKERKQEQIRKTMQPQRTAQPLDRTLRYTDIKSARAEEGIISLLADDSSFAKRLDEENITKEDFTSPFLGGIYEKIRMLTDTGQPVSAAVLSQGLSESEMAQLSRILSSPDGDGKTAMENYIYILKENRAKLGKENDIDPMLALRDLQKAKKAYGGK